MGITQNEVPQPAPHLPAEQLAHESEEVQRLCTEYCDDPALQAFIDLLDEEEKNRLLFHLLKKRQNDGLNGRTWDAGVHLKHETAIARELTRLASLTD